MNYSQFYSQLTSFRNMFQEKERNFIYRKGMYERLLKEVDTTNKEEQEFSSKLTLYKDCVNVFQQISSTCSEKTKVLFESVITEGLKIVFDTDDQRALVQYNKRGNSVDCNLLIEKRINDKWVKINPLKAYSGGVANIYSFILKLVLLLYHKEQLSKIMILDETFTHVSPHYRHKVVEFLRWINETFKVQIILVTHASEYMEGDRVIELEYSENGTIVK